MTTTTTNIAAYKINLYYYMYPPHTIFLLSSSYAHCRSSFFSFPFENGCDGRFFFHFEVTIFTCVMVFVRVRTLKTTLPDSKHEEIHINHASEQNNLHIYSLIMHVFQSIYTLQTTEATTYPNVTQKKQKKSKIAA